MNANVYLNVMTGVIRYENRCSPPPQCPERAEGVGAAAPAPALPARTGARARYALVGTVDQPSSARSGNASRVYRYITSLIRRTRRRLVGSYGVRVLLLLACCGALCALWPPRTRPPAPAPAPPAKRRRPIEAQLRADVQSQLPFLPLSYWYRHQSDSNKFHKSKHCAPFPSVFDLKFHNTYWQTLHSSRGVFHLYGAYLDVRNTTRIDPVVRLLVMHDRIKPTLPTHCQLWFEERPDPTLVRVFEYKYMWNRKWGNHRDGILQPFLLTCVLPAAVRALRPAAVSLVETPCDRATNCLRVHFDEPPDRAQKEFAVCVKGLDFLHEDISARLVEWIELLRLLGADKVFLYELQVHPNISKVISYYRSRGVVESTPITLPSGLNLPRVQHLYLTMKMTHKRQMELVPYNDCLYRHMYRYRWIVILDVDEVIVPLRDPDWSSLLKRVMPLAVRSSRKPTRSSYVATNVYYLDQPQHAHSWEPGAPRYMHMLQHVYRTRNFTKPGQYVKAFHETGRVLALHNHLPLECVGGGCSSYVLAPADAQLQHYRASCRPRALCEAPPERDAALWRWAGRLVPRVSRVLADLGLILSDASTNNLLGGTHWY